MKQNFPSMNTFCCGKVFSSITKCLLFPLLALMIFSYQGRAQVGSWTPLSTLAPSGHFNGGVMLLLPDGTVMCKSYAGGASGGVGTIWDKLTPSSTGSYAAGTWTSGGLAAMTDDRLYFSSQVMRDGRVYVCGGEYSWSGGSTGTSLTPTAKGEIYNTLTNTWAAIPTYTLTISDANSAMLPSGKILQAAVASTLKKTFIFDPATSTSVAGPSSSGIHNESAWVTLPDNSVLFVDRLATTSERYIPATNTWVADATVPVGLYDPFGDECGAAFLLPNGNAFFIGSTGLNAIYTPSGTTSPGTWSSAASTPVSPASMSQGAPDAAAAMMVNGKVLMAVSPVPRAGNHFPDSTSYYEYDYTSNTFALVAGPYGGTIDAGTACYITNMLALPNGQILFAYQGDRQYFVYTPGTAALSAGKPTVTSVARVNCDTFTAYGTLFNGISEGASYGDDWQMSTNYPLVRLTSGSTVYYARTYNWNRQGAVSTGSALDTVQFVLPTGFPDGPYTLEVVANGNPSTGFAINTSLTVSPSTSTLCPTVTATLTPSWTGGTWASSSSSIAPVGSATGVVTGGTSGSATITYTYSPGCIATATVNVSSVASITGTFSVCTGGTTTLSNSTSGGVWTSSNGTVATVGSSSGVVIGNSAGTAVITYTAGGCFATQQVTVNTQPTAITGTTTVCVGLTTTLNSTPSGGTWTSSNTAIATVNSSTGVATGVSAGTYICTYGFPTGCFVTTTVTVNPQPTAITGTTAVCVGLTTTLNSTPSGGTWSSSNVGIATIGSSTGIATGVSAGTWNCTYGLPTGCFVTTTVTVNAQPTVITGTTTVCAGLTTTLNSTPSGGVWTSSASGTASVNSTSGVVTGGSAGTANITYTLSGGCFVIQPVTVNTSPAAITGTFSICNGTTTTLSSSPSGGTWTSSNSSIATIGTGTGIASGVAPGSNVITYTLPGGCFTTHTFTVTANPSAITGTTTVCVGLTTTLNSTPSSGVWTSSASGTASVNSTSGVVTGGSAGTANITYTVSGGCFTTAPVTVNAAPNAITGTFTVCVGLTTTLSSTTSGGSWSSGNLALGTVMAGSGVVTGVSAGVVNITYTLSSGCIAVQAVTVTASPGSISGASAVCAGATTTLSSAVSGGLWTSNNTGVADVGSSSGIVSGITTGTAVITYALGGGCFATKSVTVTSAPGTISGTATVCAGATTTLGCSPSGGLWTSGATGTATVNSVSGVVTGIASGTANITYSLGTGCESYTTVTVNTSPATISGTATVCVGLSTTLSSAPSGGAWTSSATGVATVGTGTGVVSGVSVGVAGITYTLGNGCFITQIVTVNTAPGSISGTTTVCVGTTTTLSCSPSGGTWISSATGIASVGSANGVVSGVSGGTATITYSLGAGCQSTIVVTVNPNPSPITGTTVVCIGGTTALSSSPSGGVWSSSAPGIATAGTATGVVSGFSSGTATITYTVAGCFTTVVVTVNPLPTITLGANPTVLAGATSANLPYSATSGGPSTYSIAYSLAAVTAGFTNVTATALPATPIVLTVPGAAPPAVYTATLTVTNATCTSINYPISVNISSGVNTPPAFAGGTPQSLSACAFPIPNSFDLLLQTNDPDIGDIETFTVVSGPLHGTITAGGTVVSTGSPVAPFGFSYRAAYGYLGTDAFTIQVSDGAGGFATSVINVTVSPIPAIVSVTGGGGYCSGGAGVNVGLAGSAVGVNYQLYRGGVAVGSPVAGLGTSLSFGLQTVAGVYTATANVPGTSCTSNMSGSVTVYVYPLPNVYTVTGGGSYCSGGTGVTVGLSSSDIGINYRLYRGATIVGSLVAGTGAAISFGQQTVAGTYTVVAINASYTGCTINMSGSAVIVVNPLPVAYTVTGGGAFCPGTGGVHVGLGSSDVGVSYQLYRGATVVGVPLTGTGAALDFGLFAIAGTYTVRATDPVTGCTGNMSGSVAISISSLPPIFAVTGGGSYCLGGIGVNIGLGGTVYGMSYQLYLGVTAVGSPIAGTGAAITFGLQTAAGTYTVVATNTTTGCTNNMSGTALVTITALPTAYSVTGGGSYCFGAIGVHIGLGGSATGVMYQLYRGGTAVGAPLAGTGSVLDFGVFTIAGTYTVLATISGSLCANNMTGSATVIINPLPTAFSVTGGGGYCTGGTGVHVYLSGSVTGVDYQLYRGATAVGSAVAGTGASIDFGLQTIAGTYTVVATNTATGCIGNMSGSVTVTVNSLPTIYAMTGGGAYCSGGTGVAVGLAGSQSGISYQLYRGATAVGSPVSGTGIAISFGPQTIAGTYTAIATNTTTACVNNMSGSVTITVGTLPSAYLVVGGGSYCPGSSGVPIGLAGSNTGINYQLYRGATVVGSPVSGTGSAISFGLQTATGTYTVIATDATSGCAANMTGSVTIAVGSTPAIVAVTGGGTYCAGGVGVNVGLAASAAGVNYQLYLGATAVGSPVGGTGSSLGFGLQTTTGTYTVVATLGSSGCSSNMSGSATVSVAALPTVYTVTGGGAYCTGFSPGVHIGLSNSSASATYKLYRAGTPVTTIPGTGTVLDFGLYNIVGTYTVTAIASGSGCLSTMTGSAVVTVNPLPTVTGSIYTLMPGASITLIGSPSGGTWVSSNTAFATVGSSSGVVTGVSLGTLVVSYTVSTGCTGTHIVSVTSTGYRETPAATGVSNVITGSEISVLPNPTNGILTIHGTTGTPTDAVLSVIVTDMLGKVVYASKINARNGEIDDVINLDKAASGMYLLRLSSDGDTKVFRIVVEK